MVDGAVIRSIQDPRECRYVQGEWKRHNYCRLRQAFRGVNGGSDRVLSSVYLRPI